MGEVKEIKASSESVYMICQTLTQKFSDLTGKSAWCIGKTLILNEKEAGLFGQEKNKLVKKYGKEDENGNISISSESDGWDDFCREMKEISENETVMQVYRDDALTLDDFFSEKANPAEYKLINQLFILPIGDDKDEVS
jgi:hypothetical protein